MTLRELILKKIAELKEPIKDGVLSGRLEPPEYSWLTGQLQGIDMVWREISPLLDKEEDIED